VLGVLHVAAYIPSPPTNGLSLGPVRLHVYGLMIAIAIGVAVVIGQRRWEAIGGRPGTMATLAVWGVPGGLVGARLYSVVTSWQQDTHGQVWRIVAIWDGGLGIWGGVAGGILLGYVGARRHGWRLAPLLDCVAPAFAVAQAIGRLGNWFNQELYGRPTGLPWAVYIDHPSNPALGHTYQPTFLYELLWDLGTFLLLVWVARHIRLKRGYLFAVYAMAYTAGRFWVEYLRIDPAHRYGPFRLNDWTSIVVFVGAAVVLFKRGRARPGDSDVVGAPLASDRSQPDAERSPT
jgi:prolipoprotein diacylglyceryl transferase